MGDFDWTKTRYPTGDIAPTKLNGELSREDMESILNSTIGEGKWKHLNIEHGEQRTTTHTYEVEVESETQGLEHNLCGLESFGNNVQFSEDTEEWFKWEVSLGTFEKIFEKRRTKNDEKKRRALSSLGQEVNELDEGDFRGLKYAVETWRSAEQAIIRGYV